MTQKHEIEIMATLIAEQYNTLFFPMCKVREVFKCDKKSVPKILNEAGITVKKMGNRKVVTAAQIAEAICSGRVAAYDNRKISKT